MVRLLKLLCCLLVFVCLTNACELIDEKEINLEDNRNNSTIRYAIDQQENKKSNYQSKGATDLYFSNIGFGPSEVSVVDTDSIN